MTHMLLNFLLIGNDYSHSTNNRSYEAFKSWIMYRLEQCLLNRWSPQILFNLATLNLFSKWKPTHTFVNGQQFTEYKVYFPAKRSQSITHLSCSPNFPRASCLDERTLTCEPIVNCRITFAVRKTCVKGQELSEQVWAVLEDMLGWETINQNILQLFTDVEVNSICNSFPNKPISAREKHSSPEWYILTSGTAIGQSILVNA